MFEKLTPVERMALRDTMDNACDSITRLIHWAQESARGMDLNELLVMQDVRAEVRCAMEEPRTGELATHDFHDNGTDPGNCCVCHTYHRRPALANGVIADIPL